MYFQFITTLFAVAAGLLAHLHQEDVHIGLKYMGMDSTSEFLDAFDGWRWNFEIFHFVYKTDRMALHPVASYTPHVTPLERLAINRGHILMKCPDPLHRSILDTIAPSTEETEIISAE